jgi:hypothetical protein
VPQHGGLFGDRGYAIETAEGAEIAILDLESGKALTRVKLPVGP